MKLREIEDYGLKILNEKAKDGSMTVYAKFGEAEKRNQNFRIYPLEILSREVDRVQAKIASGQFLGQADHGDSPATFLKNVSHVVTGLEMKGNEGYATIKILNTDAGKNCQEIIRGKGRIGISTRSVGTVDAKTGRIQSDLRLLALDLVSNPSVKDATIGKENILEGLNFEEENTEDKMMGISEDYVESMLESIYRTQVDEEYFIGSFEDFRKKKEALIRAEILVSHKFFEETEQALKHLGEFEEAKRISNAPIPHIQRKVTPADVFYEAKMAGIDPAVYAEKLNASLDRQEALESEPDFTAQEVASILEEGRKAGIDITNPEEKKRILNIAREQKHQPEALTEKEAFIKFALAKGLKEETAELLWIEKEKEKKRKDEIYFRIKEEDMAGFGSETRPEARKRSKKIIEGE